MTIARGIYLLGLTLALLAAAGCHSNSIVGTYKAPDGANVTFSDSGRYYVYTPGSTDITRSGKYEVDGKIVILHQDHFEDVLLTREGDSLVRGNTKLIKSE